MRKNGFTLIELLAVIVILTIIALIATPIILGIINDARKESQERSVELYASAIRNGIAAYQLREMKEVKAGTYTSETLPFDVEYDGDVVCTTIELYEDGGVYVAGCIVNELEVEYTYGTKQTACILDDKDGDGIASLSDVITCGTESFYVMDNKDEQITMLSKYNLYVGNVNYIEILGEVEPLENPTGIQSELAYAQSEGGSNIYVGVVPFSNTNYWVDANETLLSQYGDSYPAYVYDDESSIYTYVNEYERILKEEIKVNSASASLMSYEQLEELGCLIRFDCPYNWVTSRDYWMGFADSKSTVYAFIVADYGGTTYNDTSFSGVRPVITISTSEIE